MLFLSCFARKPSSNTEHKKDSLRQELCRAIATNNLNAVRILLALNTPIDFLVTLESYTDIEKTQWLLQNWNTMPLSHFIAIFAKETTNILNEMIVAGISLDEQYEVHEKEYTGSILHNVLHFHNNFETFKILIDKIDNINIVNSKNQSVISTLLTIKPYFLGPNNNEEKVAILELLISKGATLNHNDINLMLDFIKQQNTFTQKALDILILCLNKNINVTTDTQGTILHFLANCALDTNISPEILIQTAINININIDATDNEGCTALHLAAQSGSIETVKTLLAYDADIYALDNNYRTVMHYAKDQFMFDILKANKAKIDEADKKGVTPLMLATQAGKLQLMTKLLTAGANISAVDKSNKNVVQYGNENLLVLNFLQTEISLRLLNQMYNDRQNMRLAMAPA